MSSWFRSYGFADVLDQLLIGAYPLDKDDVAMLDWVGVQRILNVVDDGEYRPGDREAVKAALQEAGIEERRLPLVDYGGLPPEAVEHAVQETLRWLDEGERVYLHCRAGWQRSAALAAAVIAVRDGIDIDRALEYVRARKPSADPLPHQREDLRRWWAERPGNGSLEEKRLSSSESSERQPATPPPAADGA